jgi:hypothetical protein
VSEENLVYLQDGEVVAENYEDDSFVVRILSTGEERLIRAPHSIKWRRGRFVLTWRLSNGQVAALPIAEEA